MTAPRGTSRPARSRTARSDALTGADRAARRAQKAPSLLSYGQDDPDGRWARRDAMPAAPRTDAPVGTEVRLRFAPPDAVVSENAAGGFHWTRRSSFRSAWRTAACEAAVAAVDALAPIRGCRVEVTVALPVKTTARKDPSNYRATSKPIIDGLTDAQAVWPDDCGVWVTEREPVLWTGADVVVRLVVTAPGCDWDPAEC